MKSLRETLLGPIRPLREKLDEVINGSLEVDKTNDNTTKVTEKPNIMERLGGKKTTITETIQTPEINRPKLTKEMLKFQDSSPGYRGMSYVKNGDKTTFLDEFDYQAPKITKTLSRIEIQDPRDATAPDTKKQGVVLDDPKSLALANTIKAVADEVAPEYTDYLLRLAWYEGRYGTTTKNNNSNGKGVDRGPFQINTKAFPDVPDKFAQDPVKSTLWAISVIESGNQEKWKANEFVKQATISYN